MKVDWTHKPRKRPLLYVIIMATLALYFYLVWEDLGYCFGYGDIYYEDVLAFLLLAFYAPSLILSFVMFAWQRIIGVLYVRDKIRHWLKITAVVGTFIFYLEALYIGFDDAPSPEEWYEYVIDGILGFILLIEISIAGYMQIKHCDAWHDGWNLSAWQDISLMDDYYLWKDGVWYDETTHEYRKRSSYGSYVSYSDMFEYDDPYEEQDYSYCTRGFTSMTDSYYGNHGEFDTNDRMRAAMEDMEQMSNDPGFDPHEQGYDWDEIADAKNDGYL